MKLQLVSNKVEELHLHTLSEEIDISDFALDYQPEVITSKNHFSINFVLVLPLEKNMVLHFSMKSLFKTEEEIDDDFKKSSFVYTNAPAIAFPYIRSFVSIFLLNAGYEPTILSSINFIELGKKKMESSSLK